MFVHISPEPNALGETMSTLKFAERVSTIELGAAKSNKETAGPDVRELKEQVAALRAALARKEAGSPDRHSKAEELSMCSTRRSSLDSEDSTNWPTLEEAVGSKRSARQSPDVFKIKTASTRSRRDSLDDDSDFDAATSESSELDYQFQINSIQKSSSLPTALGSKLKRPAAKPAKIQETRYIKITIYIFILSISIAVSNDDE